MPIQVNENPVDVLMRAIGVNSAAELARLAGVSAGAVYQWKQRESLPMRYVIFFAELSGLPLCVLNPSAPQAKLVPIYGATGENEQYCYR